MLKKKIKKKYSKKDLVVSLNWEEKKLLSREITHLPVWHIYFSVMRRFYSNTTSIRIPKFPCEISYTVSFL